MTTALIFASAAVSSGNTTCNPGQYWRSIGMHGDWETSLADIVALAKKRKVDPSRHRAYCSLCFAVPNEVGVVKHVGGCRAKRRAIIFVPI